MTTTVGRKSLFQDGKVKPIQRAVAMLLAQGKTPDYISKKLGVGTRAIWEWQRHDVFTDLVDRYNKEFLEKVEKKELSNIDFLEQVKEDSLKDKNPRRSDGIRAAEILAKISGEIGGNEKEVREKVKKLSNKELAILAEAQNAANTTTSNRGGTGKTKK